MSRSTRVPSRSATNRGRQLRDTYAVDYRTGIGRIGDVDDVIELGHGGGVHVLRSAECSTSAPAGGAGDIGAAPDSTTSSRAAGGPGAG